jgi:hypothetical protein
MSILTSFIRDTDASRFSIHSSLTRIVFFFQFVLVVDDENRENEGDLIMAGSLVTPQAMAFLVRHSTGIVCVSMKGEDLDRLGLPLMVPQKNNSESMKTAFTWTVVCYSDPTLVNLALKSIEAVFFHTCQNML